MWWETKWGRPSRGDPRFERVPLAVHEEDALVDLMAEGGAVGIVDDADLQLRRLSAAVEAGRDPFAGWKGAPE